MNSFITISFREQLGGPSLGPSRARRQRKGRARFGELEGVGGEAQVRQFGPAARPVPAHPLVLLTLVDTAGLHSPRCRQLPSSREASPLCLGQPWRCITPRPIAFLPDREQGPRGQ